MSFSTALDGDAVTDSANLDLLFLEFSSSHDSGGCLLSLVIVEYLQLLKHVLSIPFLLSAAFVISKCYPGAGAPEGQLLKVKACVEVQSKASSKEEAVVFHKAAYCWIRRSPNNIKRARISAIHASHGWSHSRSGIGDRTKPGTK